MNLRAKDLVVLGALFWFLLRDREDVTVNLDYGEPVETPGNQLGNGSTYQVEPSCNCKH